MTHPSLGHIVGPRLGSLTYGGIFASFGDFADEGEEVNIASTPAGIQILLPYGTGGLGCVGAIRMPDKQDTIYSGNTSFSKS